MEFINSLVVAAKKGNTRSYLELCQFYGKQIYQLIYQLLPDKKPSQKLTVDVFIYAWENIQKFNMESDFTLWLSNIAFSKSFFFYQNEEYELWSDGGFEHDFISLNQLVYTGLENSFLELSIPEKISFKLYSDFECNFEIISKFLDLENSEAAKELVMYSIRILAHGGGFNILANLNFNQMKILIDKLKHGEDSFDIISEEADKSILKEYRELSNELHSSFENIEIPENIVKQIHDGFKELVIELKTQESIVSSKIEKKKKTKKVKPELKKRRKISFKKLFQPSKWPFVSDAIKRNKILPIAVPLVIIGTLIFYFLFLSKANEPWLISHTIGNFRINGVISNSTSVSEYDKISTDIKTSLYLAIPATANIKIFSNTELQIIKPFDNDKVIKLTRGEIELQTYKTLRELEKITDTKEIIIQTRFGKLKTESAVLKIKILKNDSSLIQLSRGWAEFLFPDERVYLAAGYKLNINEKDKYRVPLNVNASDIIVSAIVNQSSPLDYAKVLEIIQAADQDDLLTLLHLLKYTDSVSRERIIEYIRKYIPFIDEKVKYKLKNLDEVLFRELAMFIRKQSVS